MCVEIHTWYADTVMRLFDTEFSHKSLLFMI